MKIFLFGGAGQLGREIQKRAADWGAAIVAPLEEDLDITNREAVSAAFSREQPHCVINAAAYTAVDRAEADEQKVFHVNADGPAVLAASARTAGARFVHVSTDYVFDGLGHTPLNEMSPTKPAGVYGRSKLEGEQRVLSEYEAGSVIVRTSSLHGAFGGNFVHTMLRLFKEKDRIEVVDDQIMSPTWAGWLAEVLLDLSTKHTETGIFHASGAGATSWYDFAAAIKELTSGQLDSSVDTIIERVPLAAYKAPAPRPRYSVLDCSRLAAVLGRPSIPWLNGLKCHLTDIGYTVR